MGESRQQEHLEWIRSFFEKEIPFNAYLGFELVELSAGHALLRMPYREVLVGDPTRPALHGGTLSALADTAGGAAAFTVVQPGDTLSTLDLRIDYLRPGRPEDVWAETTVVRSGNRVVVARIILRQSPRPGKDEDFSVIAEATGVYSVLRRAG